MTSMSEYEKFKTLVGEATPGPWKADTGVRGDCVVWGPNGRFLMNAQAEPHWVPDPSGKERAVAFDADKRDIEYIAASRDMVPRMVQAIDEIINLYNSHHYADPNLASDMIEAILHYVADEVPEFKADCSDGEE